MAAQILIRLPEEIANRLKAAVPPRQRNRFVAQLVEKALADRERALGQIADAVTADERQDDLIRRELSAWGTSTIADRLNNQGCVTRNAAKSTEWNLTLPLAAKPAKDVLASFFR